jgi:hypothetical protein
MKKIMFVILVVLGISAAPKSEAQVSVSINIGSQPAWGPTGYNHVDFYYLPDINAYYDVTRAQYVYQNGPRWVYVSALPARYRNYDVYNSYKVVINEPRPFIYNNVHISKYARYKGNHTQQIIRDSRDDRYSRNNGNRRYEKPGNGPKSGYAKNNKKDKDWKHDNKGHGKH